MKKTFAFICVLCLLSAAFAQTHTAAFGDERFMECVFKGFYSHCVAKHDLEDGKWMFYYPNTDNLAVVTFVENKKWNGFYYSYREDGSLSLLSTYKNGVGNGEYRGYWPNGQMHYKYYEPGGEFIAIDSSGKIIKHVPASLSSSVRKPFAPINIPTVFQLFIYQDSSEVLSDKDSLFELVRFFVRNTPIYEIKKKESLPVRNTSIQREIILIGNDRSELLSHLGTDFYIMTESFVDYVLDITGEPLLDINKVPSFVLRCCFEDDIVNKIFCINQNENISYRAICRFLQGL